MIPTPGRIVHYRLSEGDVDAIQKNRAHLGLTSVQANSAEVGEYYPAMVVRTFNDGRYLNLKVELDGYDVYWATSRQEGDGNGEWTWPPRV